jgi:hypothetical protein
MADDKNRLRRQVTDEVGAGIATAMRRDRKGLVILLLQVINAVWLASLWEGGFNSVPALLIWAVFFTLTLIASIAIEKRRP